MALQPQMNDDVIQNALDSVRPHLEMEVTYLSEAMDDYLVDKGLDDDSFRQSHHKFDAKPKQGPLPRHICVLPRPLCHGTPRLSCGQGTVMSSFSWIKTTVQAADTAMSRITDLAISAAGTLYSTTRYAGQLTAWNISGIQLTYLDRDTFASGGCPVPCRALRLWTRAAGRRCWQAVPRAMA